MKKKIIFIILLGLLIAILFLIPKDTYKKIFGQDDTKISNDDLKETVLVYMCNQKEQLVGVNAYVNAIEEDVIAQKFDIITNKTGEFKDNYATTVNTKTTLLSYEIEEDVLTLNVSNDILESEGRTTLEQLVWTFCNDDISEIVISIDDEPIHCLNDYQYDKLTKDMGINLCFETNYLFEANHTTIIEYTNDLIIPVTYFYIGMDECDFIVSKLFDSEIVMASGYEYELTPTSLIIDVSTNDQLSPDLKQSIKQTIKYNLGVSNITIQGIDSVLLEITE